MKTISINDILNNKKSSNLWQYEGKYYRLFAKGITPNNCWLIAPEMRELVDIDVATGKDIYGEGRLGFDGITGTVDAYQEFVRL